MSNDGGLTEEDVVEGYQVFLERAPESAEVIALHRAGHPNRASFLHAMTHAAEFTNRVAGLAVRQALHGQLIAPVETIQHDAPPETMTRLLDRIRRQWTHLGDTEPHWSVLTADRFKANQINDPANLAEFHASGEREARLIDLFGARTGVPHHGGVCIELGCGVGRVTRRLADRFDKVIALDISPGNLALCRAFMDQEGVTNVETRLMQGLEDFDDLPEADFFFTAITLQHNPPPVQKLILRKIFQRLKPNGLALFQILGEAAGYSFEAESYLSTPPPAMEMHVLRRAVALAEMRDQGLYPLDVVADAHTGDIIGSVTIYGQKTA